jgi:putative lipoprotein
VPTNARVALLIFTSLWLAACATTDGTNGGDSIAPGDTVTGTVSYRERITLPPGAVVQVRLLDVPGPNETPTPIADATITDAGQVPIEFAIEFDPATIDGRHAYQLEATVYVNGRAVYRNSDPYPVITRGHGLTADVLVKRTQ